MSSVECLQSSTLDPRPSTLLLVDGHAYAYRAFYAIRGMRSPLGESTGAIFGFVKALEKLQQMVNGQRSEGEGSASEVLAFGLQPSALTVVVWDGGLAAERVAVLPGYKAQRPEMPAELGAQIEGIAEFLAAAGVPSVCVAGREADDLIAGLAGAAAAEGRAVLVASSDKDFMQLVSEERQKDECRMGSEGFPSSFPVEGRIGLLNPNDKSERVWGAAAVRAKAGVSPAQVVDWLALVGDAVDNIPGVPGVGPKTAADLLARFGSVAGIYERLAEVKSERLRGALVASEAVVRRNQDLVRLKDGLPAGVSLAELRQGEPDWQRLAELFRRWGFRGWLAEAQRRLEKAQSERLPPSRRSGGAAEAVCESESRGAGLADQRPERGLVEQQAVLL